ncbi:MAG: acyl-CoA dehydrogenase [Epsilonproteobacteria bacterium]|nr:MAG: acyl-CoA dehydrogenase [Campylobacterota bacterium]RLA67879.1 MAG: acyl-CoA dehydrogenase [Campylobacterota bacterium]
MAEYKTDLEDIYFNIFNILKVQDLRPDYGQEDLQAIVEEFDRFTKNEIFPIREEGDRVGVKMVEGQVKVPESYVAAKQKFYENGWFALGMEEEWEGMPATNATYMACQSLYIGANVSFSMYPGLTKGALNCIKTIGSEEQKNLYIPKMMEGTWGGTMCLTEAGAGSDIGATRTTATPTKDGKYKISGVKIFISSGESNLYENNIHMVLARTPGAPEGVKGISLFIVPRFKIENGESNDVKCTKIEEKMGIHGSATCELTFGENGNCEGSLIGEEFKGMSNMFLIMNEARLLCALQGEAQANLATILSIQYAREREQFGKNIIEHPDIKRMLLKMRAMSRGMRGLVLYTANLFDNPEAEDEIALLTPLCKGFCTDAGFEVCVDAVQVHGGYGYCFEYGMEQFIRDTKIATIYEGTNGIQAIDFVLRKIFKDEGKEFAKLGQKIMATLTQDIPAEWQNETNLMKKNMEKSQEILARFKEFYSSKKLDQILENSTDFLTYCGNLVVSWILLGHALEAQKLLSDESSEQKEFYLSKVTDFKVFCAHYLTRNTAISQTILNFPEGLSKLEV